MGLLSGKHACGLCEIRDAKARLLIDVMKGLVHLFARASPAKDEAVTNVLQMPCVPEQCQAVRERVKGQIAKQKARTERQGQAYVHIMQPMELRW